MKAKKKAERELMSIFDLLNACMPLPYATQIETPIYVYSVGKAKEKSHSHAKHFIRRSVCRKS
jgi:hypothetical protein